MFGVWGGYGVGVSGSTSKNAAREVRVREVALGGNGPSYRAMNLQDFFPKSRVPKELSRWGVSGKGSEADGNAGPLSTPACQGNRDHPGGGKPPPPTVPLVRHAGALEGVERLAYYHRSVCQRGRK